LLFIVIKLINMLPKIDIHRLNRNLSLIVNYLRTRDFYDLPRSLQFNKYLYSDKENPDRNKIVPNHDRLIVYPRDIEIIYRKTDHIGRSVLKEIRNSKCLPQGAPVLINDLCEHTGFDYKMVYNFMNERKNSIEPWNKFYKTRDWYDIPDSIDLNNLLYKNMDALHDDLRSNKFRLIIYPKDIENIYNCTPDEARSFLQDIRQSFSLSISGPVMLGDLRNYLEIDHTDILIDCIKES
jgi:hypothetical protein